jgi:hypothetical protein
MMLVMALACGCSEPLMHNVPRPPTNTAAGVGAAAAAAAALIAADADPRTQQEQAEEGPGAPPPRVDEVRATVPADVLDRADTAPPDARTGTPVVAPTPPKAGPPAEPFVPTMPLPAKARRR